MGYSEMEVRLAETVAITLKKVKELNVIVEENLSKGLLNADSDVRASRDVLLNVLSTLDFELYKKCFPVMEKDVTISEDLQKIIHYGKEVGSLQYDDMSYYGMV